MHVQQISNLYARAIQNLYLGGTSCTKHYSSKTLVEFIVTEGLQKECHSAYTLFNMYTNKALKSEKTNAAIWDSN